MNEKVKTDAEYAAENDARILKDADLIKKDNVRYVKAQVQAAKMAAEELKNANAYKNVSKKVRKTGSSSNKKGVVKKVGVKKKVVAGKKRRRRSKILM